MVPRIAVSATRAQTHYVQTHLVRGSDGEDSPALSWVRSGAPHPELNRVLRVGPDAVERSIALMDHAPALWSVWPNAGDGNAVERALERNGLVFVEEEPLLVLPLDPGAASGLPEDAAVPGVEIEACRTLEQLREWVSFWAAEAVSPERFPEIVRALAGPAGLDGSADAEATPAVTHFLARSSDAATRGRVLGCAALVIAGLSAAVEHVITAQAERGRGIGSWLTRRVIEGAHDAGAEACVLTSSPDGLGLYTRLGFRPECRIRSYAFPA
ncbi:GNAT family N-acetyltransferase [Leucobacter sp. M11]|uniref:GNAT family N-acetyltransferase n=1 Tax=Leucobacter sp. M11 TaxID=2993565 RepID=UPI002D7F4CD3|nr:GNAT family N-acetyltransferase [Leucobacter sp. M11]MEB4613923.1 GNAT family N-acetyltransferase [Leucobacter sp. M11]